MISNPNLDIALWLFLVLPVLWKPSDNSCDVYLEHILSLHICQEPFLPGATFNSFPPGQNGHHFTDHIFKCIFLNENIRISIQILLKFVPKGPIDNKQALVEVMACRLFGTKPLPEPILTRFTDAYMRHKEEMSWIAYFIGG